MEITSITGMGAGARLVLSNDGRKKSSCWKPKRSINANYLNKGKQNRREWNPLMQGWKSSSAGLMNKQVGKERI